MIQLYYYYFYSQLRSLVTNAVNAGYGTLWVGLTDEGENNVWRFFCGQEYDGFDESQEAAWYWGSYQGNSADQNCAYVRDDGGSVGITMGDDVCGNLLYGICEVVSQIC